MVRERRFVVERKVLHNGLERMWCTGRPVTRSKLRQVTATSGLRLRVRVRYRHHRQVGNAPIVVRVYRVER